MSNSKTLLGVNIDHVATLRKARGECFPDPVEHALICQSAGADSIVAHLREDRRHVEDEDVVRLRNALTIRLNLEMSMHESVVETALKASPDQATIVPEKREEKTTESGLNVIDNFNKLKNLSNLLTKASIQTSFFVDPCNDQIDATIECGVNAIEIHTGDYSNAKSESEAFERLSSIKNAAKYALDKGLVVHVGHGLNYGNVADVARIQGLTEFNIGFSIIARSLVVGLYEAVREMRDLLDNSSTRQ